MRRVIKIILMMAMLTMTVGESFAANWYDTNWSYRRMITVDHTRVQDVANPSSAYADFPVLIYLTGLSNINVNGTDIRFTASDGTTELPREIESYSGGTLYAWVKVTLTRDSSDPSDDVVYMYYGNSGASEPSPGSAYGSENAWDSDYLMVQHLQESPNDNNAGHIDSTSNPHNFMPLNFQDGGGGTTNAAGKIGGADSFAGDDDYLAESGFDSVFFEDYYPAAWTFSAWIKTSTPGRTIYTEGRNTSVAFIIVQLLSNGEFHSRGHDDWWNSTHSFTSNATGLHNNTWRYVTFANNSGNLDVYIDGDFDQNVTYALAPQTISITKSTIGAFRRNGVGGYFNGSIDEVRASKTKRSAEWIKTSHTNQNAPGSFMNSGSEISSTATVTWTGATNTDWNTPTNWDIGEVPADTHSVFIPNVATAPTLDITRTIASLMINGETLDLNGNDLTVTGDLTIINSGVLNAGTGSPTITVGNNWDSTDGTFIRGTSTIKMTGSPVTLSLKRVGWNAFTHNIIIDTGAEVTYSPGSSNISGNLTINDSATFTSSNRLGIIDPAKTITLGTGATLHLPGYFYLVINDTSPYMSATGTITTGSSGGIIFCAEAGNTAAKMTARSYDVDILVATTGSAAKAVLGGGTGTLDLNNHDLYLWDKGQNCAAYGTLDNSGDIPIVNGGKLEVAPTWNNAAFVGKLIAHDATYDFASVDIYNGGEIDGVTGSGTSTWTVTGDIIFKHSSTILTAGGSSWTVGGNWNNAASGTFTPGSSTVTFNGSSDQTIATGGDAFNNLTLNNTGASGNDDIIVNGLLDVDGVMTITDGNLDLNTNDPDVNSSGDVTIDTNGSVTNGTGTWTFDGTTDFTDNSSGGPQNLGIVVVD